MAAAKKESRPLVVRLTPPGVGAVAVVLVEGTGAAEIVSARFTPHSGLRLADLPVGRIVLGRWGGPEGEELIACRRAEDRVEVHPHGGRAAVDRVVQDLAQNGAMECSWHEWVSQHECCPIRAAARTALADAPTLRTAAILLDQFHGALRRELERSMALLSSNQVQQAADVLAPLADRSELGRHLVEPWRVVLAGPPNVGKSSLINALVGYQRAVVYEQPGTTRDVVTARTAIDGWPVELSDTAGLRTGGDPLEAAGVQLAERLLHEADAIVFVSDAASGHRRLPERWTTPTGTPRRVVMAVNKVDLIDEGQRAALVSDARCQHVQVCATSAVTREGVDELLAAIARCLIPNPPPRGTAVPFQAHQCDAIEASLASIRAGDAATAARAVQHLLTTTPEA